MSRASARGGLLVDGTSSWRYDCSGLRETGEALRIRPPGSPDRRRARPQPDKYAGKHIQGELLEDVTAQAINRFLASREEQDGWSRHNARSLTCHLKAEVKLMKVAPAGSKVER